MSSKQLPIGVFDSGSGGLHILKALERSLVGERFVYLADLARLPYGDRSIDDLQGCLHEVYRWMSQVPVKLLVIACNTCSSLPPKFMSTLNAIPIIDTITPITAISNPPWTSSDILGIIATRATVQRRVLANRIRASNPQMAVHAVSCPTLAPLIEDGTEVEIALQLQQYLAPLIEKRITKLLYGCTHYSYLDKLASEILGTAVNIVDPTDYVAQAARAYLSEHDLAAPENTHEARTTFYATANPQILERKLQHIFQQSAQVSLTTL